MSLLDLIPFEDYEGNEINHNFEVYVLHAPGCLGNFYASTLTKAKPIIVHEKNYITDKEFLNYAKLYTWKNNFYLAEQEQSVHLFEGNHNIDLQFEFDYDKIIKGLDKYVSLKQTEFPSVLVNHYPIFLSSIVSNFTFDKFVIIQFEHTLE